MEFKRNGHNNELIMYPASKPQKNTNIFNMHLTEQERREAKKDKENKIDDDKKQAESIRKKDDDEYVNRKRENYIEPENPVYYKNEDVIASQLAQKEAEQQYKCKIKIDFTFIEKREGKNTLKAYTLDPQKSKSGVTIATGFDLGARDENDLKRLNINKELINKLKPYLRIKRQEAKKYLKDNPLSITIDESIEINNAVREQIIQNLIKKYDAESKIKFICMPSDAQTVIYSVEFQYGSAKTETHNFWRQAINQEWKNMYNNLMHFGDEHEKRREVEAQLIKRLL